LPSFLGVFFFLFGFFWGALSLFSLPSRESDSDEAAYFGFVFEITPCTNSSALFFSKGEFFRQPYRLEFVTFPGPFFWAPPPPEFPTRTLKYFFPHPFLRTHERKPGLVGSFEHPPTFNFFSVTDVGSCFGVWPPLKHLHPVSLLQPFMNESPLSLSPTPL